MTFVPLQLPQLLDVTTMEEAQFYGDYALLTFPLRDPYDLEEVMDLFEDDMELITLYHHIPTHADKFGHSTCAYSNPAFGQMFKMNCKTDADDRRMAQRRLIETAGRFPKSVRLFISQRPC